MHNYQKPNREKETKYPKKSQSFSGRWFLSAQSVISAPPTGNMGKTTIISEQYFSVSAIVCCVLSAITGYPAKTLLFIQASAQQTNLCEQLLKQKIYEDDLSGKASLFSFPYIKALQ